MDKESFLEKLKFYSPEEINQIIENKGNVRIIEPMKIVPEWD